MLLNVWMSKTHEDSILGADVMKENNYIVDLANQTLWKGEGDVGGCVVIPDRHAVQLKVCLHTICLCFWVQKTKALLKY